MLHLNEDRVDVKEKEEERKGTKNKNKRGIHWKAAIHVNLI